MKVLRLILIFSLLLSGCKSSKTVSHKLEINPLELQVIQETLPDYLDSNPNSIASFLKKNSGYKVFYNGINMFNEYGLVKDSLEVKKIENDLKRLEKLSDSVETLLKTKKIEVLLSDTLHIYNYIAKEYQNLKNEDDWTDEYEDLKEEFTKNRWRRLDTTISVEFVGLIKQQIDIKQTKSPLDLEQFNSGYYRFIKKELNCKDLNFCFNGNKLFKPVFNKKKNKACYLISFECRSGTCRDFVFIEKKNGKWIFVDDYASHLIGKED